MASTERTDGSSSEQRQDHEQCLSSRQGPGAASVQQSLKEVVISGHCLAQQRGGAMWRGGRDTASTSLTFVMTQLCQPRLSAHLSWCWFLRGPEDLGRWLHVLDDLSSQVVGTRGLTALLVIPQSRAQPHSQ